MVTLVTHAVARRRPPPPRPKRAPFVGVSFLFTLGFGLKPLVGRLKTQAKKRQGRKVAGGETDG